MTGPARLPTTRTWWFWSLAIGVPAVLIAVLAVVIADDEEPGLFKAKTFGSASEKPPIDDLPSENFDEDGTGELTVVDSGFSTFRTSDDQPAFSFAAILENPTDREARDVEIEVEAVNADGVSFGGSVTTVAAIPPRGRTAVAFELMTGSDIARAQVHTQIGRLAEPEKAPTFTVSDIRTRETEAGVGEVTARVEVGPPRSLRTFQVVAVFRDDKGAIIGGASSFVSVRRGGEPTEVTITPIAPVPGVASAEVYAYS